MPTRTTIDNRQASWHSVEGRNTAGSEGLTGDCVVTMGFPTLSDFPARFIDQRVCVSAQTISHHGRLESV